MKLTVKIIAIQRRTPVVGDLTAPSNDFDPRYDLCYADRFRKARLMIYEYAKKPAQSQRS